MIDFKFLDSSIWLAYFFNGFYADVIDSDEIFLLSVLSLFEIKNKLIKNNTEVGKIKQSIDLIKQKSLLINVDEEIVEQAVEISIKNNLPAIDSLIYSSALKNNSVLVTLDNDFRNLNNVLILD